jgi:uncharacterized membrane protein
MEARTQLLEEDSMSTFVAITFDGPGDAQAALGSVRALEHEARIGIEDTAVVSKDADGAVHVKNEMASGTETGAAVGAVLGGLLFMVFPVGAIVGGAVVGGLVGRAAAPGIDGQFVKEVEDGLKPGGSALFLQLKGGGDLGLLIGSMRQYSGRVAQTTLDDEQEEALRQALL